MKEIRIMLLVLLIKLTKIFKVLKMREILNKIYKKMLNQLEIRIKIKYKI